MGSETFHWVVSLFCLSPCILAKPRRAACCAPRPEAATSRLTEPERTTLFAAAVVSSVCRWDGWCGPLVFPKGVSAKCFEDNAPNRAVPARQSEEEGEEEE
ncbi:unnamed protein product [Toxocara canis]|uniref:Secreted protein n=1 Tax=Toxocara canis TaxID=6265 RepID=A0A183VB48_TOXCA|nr:unnamed protein product [Toxocara canis]